MPHQEVEVGLNDVRTVAFVQDFRLNNQGEIAFVAEFDDGTSAIMVSLVPEPSMLLYAWMGIASICLVARGGKHRRTV